MKIFEFAKNNIFLIIVLLVSFFLRFYHLDFQSVWLDEIHTINETNPNFSLSELYKSIFEGEQMPPLYFIIVHILFKIFGYTPYVVRAFSAILGICGVLSTYKLGKEIFDRKTASISALLIALNYFHIYYSQEARPYVFLYLFTTLSFLYLIRFIKKPSYKTALLYGCFAALMIYGHFFALFTLVSQYIFLAFIFYKHENKKSFFIYGSISAIITVILQIPSISILLNISKISSFWIQPPSLDVYTTIFKDFFGGSELLLFIISVVSVFYFIAVFLNQDKKERTVNEIIQNKPVFSFILFASWLAITLLIPLIRSYLQVPMIVNRYFMVLLPAIVIILGYGFRQIKSKLAQCTMLLLFVIFSLVDIFIVKNYYGQVNKTQFREVSQFIIDNNKKKDPIYTSLSWYFNYFLNNDSTKMDIVEKPLEVIVNEMIQDSTKRIDFWYVDGHNKPYAISETAQNFLDDNFEVEENVDLFDCWAKFYVRNSNALTQVDVSSYKPLNDENGAKIKFWIESFEITNDQINVGGWAYIEGQDAINSDIKVVLIAEGKAYKTQTQQIKRIDVTKASNTQFNFDNSGFLSKTKVNKLAKGNYRVGILVKNRVEDKEGLVLTEKTFDLTR